jgi:hypothetical protein
MADSVEDTVTNSAELYGALVISDDNEHFVVVKHSDHSNKGWNLPMRPYNDVESTMAVCSVVQDQTGLIIIDHLLPSSLQVPAPGVRYHRTHTISC